MMQRVAHLRCPRRPALPLFNDGGADAAADIAFRFDSLFPHLPVASLTVSVLLFLSADEVLFECAPLNRSACGLVYSDAMWRRCHTLFFARLPASDVLRALLGQCATCREIVLCTGTNTLGLSALSAAASSAHSNAKGAVRAAQQHSAHLSFLGASSALHSHSQAASTSATAPAMDDVALLSGSAGARLSAAHHRFWCRFLTLLHALPDSPCFGTTLRRLDFRRAFPFPSLHHTNFVLELRPFRYTEPGCPEYLPSREHAATLVARAFAPLFFADGSLPSPMRASCSVTEILLDRIEMPHVLASMRHVRTCGVARAEAEVQHTDQYDLPDVAQHPNAALDAIRSMAVFAPLQANAATLSLQTRARISAATVVSPSPSETPPASTARSLFVLAPSLHASSAASSHASAFPLPLHIATTTLPTSSSAHSSHLFLPTAVPLPAAPPSPSSFALSASLHRISLGAHGYMHINDLLCLAALPALQTLDTGARACDFGTGGPWHATDAILRAAQRAMLRTRCDRPFAALRALSATVEVAAAVLFLLAVGRRRPSFLPQHPSLPPFAPQRSLSLSHPTSRVNSGHSNASGGGGGSRHASLVGLRSLSNSSGNGNLSVRSASLRPSRANSLSWSSTRASVSTSSPMAAASSSAASACSTAEVPPAEFLLRVLRLVATPPNAALSFAFLPSAAATAAAAAEAAMGSRHHHGDSSSLSVATPSTTQSSSVNASVSAAAAAPAIEGAAPTLHVNDILSGAPNLQMLLADTSLHASRASAAALTPFLGLGASSSTPAARDAMLRHPEAFAALTSVRVRLSDLLDRESRDEMLEFLSSCKMLRSVHIVRNAMTAIASNDAVAAHLSGKAPSSPALPPADSSLPTAAAASSLLSASYKNRTPFTFGGAASGGLPPTGSADFSLGGAMHAKHEALSSVSASATAPAAAAAAAAATAPATAAAKMFRSAWSEDEVVAAVKQQVTSFINCRVRVVSPEQSTQEDANWFG